MSEFKKVTSFLQSVTYEEKRCRCLNEAEGLNPFITISREAGAGGNSLAQAILDEIKKQQKAEPLFEGWQVFNQELYKKIAEEPGLNVSLRSLMESERHSIIEDMMRELINHETPQDVVSKKIFQLILTLAVAGKAIIVGRGAACLTRNLPFGIHIRLVASLGTRVKRMTQLLNLNRTEKKVKELIQEQDKAREKLVRIIFDKDIKDPLLYDVTWNTDAVPMDEIARSVVSLIKSRACYCAAGTAKILNFKSRE